MMKLFVQNETNIIKLYVSSWLILKSSYNIRALRYYWISTYICSAKQLSYLVNAGTSRILEDKVTRIYDENRIKIVYCDQRRYDSSKHSDNEDKGVMGLIETSDNDDDEIIRPLIPDLIKILDLMTRFIIIGLFIIEILLVVLIW